MSPSPAEPRFGVLVPVKPPAVAKSRLLPLGDAARASLVVAFAVDTITAALESPLVARVIAITDDYVLASALSELGARVIPDGTVDDLNASLILAALELRRESPELRIAALCADLPALRTDELTHAMTAASDFMMSFVADEERVGTTACFAPSVEQFRPEFGHGSRQAHLDAGAIEIDLDVATLRRDVDTPDNLFRALGLGVGSRTSLLATSLRL